MNETTPPLIGIVAGSKSDLEVLEVTRTTLEEFGVPCELVILSAHRKPVACSEYAAGAAGRGLRLLIAGAGMAAHLAGVLASRTTLPVLAVPLVAGTLGGLDALLAMSQMPGGVPVAVFAIGKAGAKNAALFAVQVLSLSDPDLAARFAEFKRRLAEDN